ncbi:arginine deiminase [Acrasis kona]|uniref:Arginine deiminase n=1 Tax=Acrasis kona TaxID=1008807 RepID=A0AAW2ZSC7_9EUKA
MNMSSQVVSFTHPQQCHENDVAEVVLVHEPGIEALFGSLHASGSLFEKPVNLQKARENHEGFRDVLTKRGIQVLTVRNVLEMHCERNFKYRVELEVTFKDLALEGLRYQLESMEGDYDLTAQQIHLLSNTYKRECLQTLGTKDLIDIILMGPTIRLIPESINTPLRLEKLSMKPLLNLTFTRDQQIVTNRGLVISNMGSLQRKRETQIMKYCFQKMGLEVLGEIEAPGLLEGGDFIAAGSDLCFIGVGLRTNEFATNQMMKNDWFGTRRVAVVRDLFDCDQQRMHLDTVFNIASHDVCVMLNTLIGKNSPERRLVTEYTKGADGLYHVSKENIELAQYVQDEGYHIVSVTVSQQADYGINFLNIGEGTIVAVDESTARTLLKSGVYKGDVDLIDYSGMTTMYGSVHCCSQVLKRRRSEVNSKYHQELPNSNQTRDASFGTGGVVIVGPSYVLGSNKSNGSSSSSITKRVPLSEEQQSSRLPASQNVFANSSTLVRIRSNFSQLHSALEANGVNVHIVAHYPHEKTPWGMFVSHIVYCDGGRATFTPLDSKRTAERKERLVDLYQSIYGQDHVKVLDHKSAEKSYGNACFVVDKRQGGSVYTTSDSNDAAAPIVDRPIKVIRVDKQDKRQDSVLDLVLTNSVLFIGSKFFVICDHFVTDRQVQDELQQAGKQCIEVSLEQRNKFAVNGLVEMEVNQELILFASNTAWGAFDDAQRRILEQSVSRVVQVGVDEIEEQWGGSLNDLISIL